MPIAPEAKSSKSDRLASQWVGYPRRTGRAGLHSVEGHLGKPMADENATNTQCGGKKKAMLAYGIVQISATCLLYTSPSPRDVEETRMPSSA